VYRDARQDIISVEDASKLANALGIMVRLLEQSQTESRVKALEKTPAVVSRVFPGTIGRTETQYIGTGGWATFT
jgi:hypothetical protein